MITLEDYFAGHKGNPEITEEHVANATELLRRVNALLLAAPVDPPVNPRTETQVSGSKDGGWRPRECLTGAPNSAHKAACAVDIFDPDGKLERWITYVRLERFDLYREAPDSTPGWVHLTTRAPASGNRTFIP